MNHRLAPGPPGNWLLGHVRPFRHEALKLFLDGHRRCGDVVRFRLGPRPVHLLAHPDHIRHVLITNQPNYDKDTWSSSKICEVTGSSLLTSSGAFWLRQRRLMQPAFHPSRLANFADLMSSVTAGMLRNWQEHAINHRPIDVASEMMRVTFTIVGQALFGADVRRDLDTVEWSATEVMAHTYRRAARVLDLPSWLPTPGNRRFLKGRRSLDRVVYRIIDDRRLRSGTDFVSLLQSGRDEETGDSMTRQQLRNESLTLLLAGHETTANALTWTWYLLATHPDIATRLHEEIVKVLGNRSPTAADLPRLTYATMVIREAMRLYPPIWILERHVRADDAVGGYHVPEGSAVVLSPYVTHRHPAFWSNPEVFDPERFRTEDSAGRPAQAYFPFGAGQRLCIGNQFAIMEALIIVAMVMQRFRLALVPGVSVEPQPGITLRCRPNLPMTLHDES